jgi:hypothetical protein
MSTPKSFSTVGWYALISPALVRFLNSPALAVCAYTYTYTQHIHIIMQVVLLLHTSYCLASTGHGNRQHEGDPWIRAMPHDSKVRTAAVAGLERLESKCEQQSTHQESILRASKFTQMVQPRLFVSDFSHVPMLAQARAGLECGLKGELALRVTIRSLSTSMQFRVARCSCSA